MKPHAHLPVLAILVLGLCSLPVSAQADPLAKPADVTDPRDLEAFFDGILHVQRETKHIAGAVVAVVAGDKVIFSKGYGYADVAARQPVDPEKTMFRIGSITKLFTWTAVMQQVEAGKLDLDADVNKYLGPVQIPATYPQPITLKHLMTHTPGFEDRVIGLFARRPDERPLAEILRGEIPARVRPPGQVVSYSNHGTGLAGLAVATVSGLPWEDYVEQRILKPLGMEHTLTRQPAADKLPANVSHGYKWQAGRFQEKDFEYVPMGAAGCMSMSAADAGRFMLAYLHDGQLGGAAILKPETVRKMREPLFQPDPKTSALCYGFLEQRRDGKQILGHGGATLWFHSLLLMVPQQKVGVFISYNTNTGATAHGELFDAFWQRYFAPAEPPALTTPSDFRQRAARLVGEYGNTRISHTSPTKLIDLLSGYKVTLNNDDTLSITGRETRRYAEKEPFVFRRVDSPDEMVFHEDAPSHALYLVPAYAPFVCAVKRQWYERSLFHWSLLGASLGVLASAVLFWPVIAFSLRGYQAPGYIRRSAFSAVLSWLAWLLGIVSIVFAVGAGVGMSDSTDVVFGLPPLLKGLLYLAPVCAVLAAFTVVGCLIAWGQRYWRLTGRLHYTLVALAGAGFTWFLYYWNLLPFPTT
jgi:CubicO group peptidase (beta-lactamase class C family)